VHVPGRSVALGHHLPASVEAKGSAHNFMRLRTKGDRSPIPTPHLFLCAPTNRKQERKYLSECAAPRQTTPWLVGLRRSPLQNPLVFRRQRPRCAPTFKIVVAKATCATKASAKCLRRVLLGAYATDGTGRACGSSHRMLLRRAIFGDLPSRSWSTSSPLALYHRAEAQDPRMPTRLSQRQRVIWDKMPSQKHRYLIDSLVLLPRLETGPTDYESVW